MRQTLKAEHPKRMTSWSTRLSLAALLLCSVCAAQTSLTDAQVIEAINHALSGKHHSIGLTLNDVQTNVFSGLMCKTCQTSGYTIYVYTPESWIELKAVQARREMLPFGLADVTPEMKLPYIHVVASPSKPEYLDAGGMGRASSVHRIVLSSTDRSDVVQPLSESHGEVELNSALRSFTQASAGAVFSLADVERLRSEDPNREFFVVVVGDNQNKYFKVKTRFFKQLFGGSPEGTYSASELGPIQAKTRDKRANGSAEAVRAEEPHSLAADGLEPGRVVTRTPQPGSEKPRRSQSPEPAAPNRATETVTPPESDAYKHDRILIAQWWHLNETNVDPSVISSSTVGANGVTVDVSSGTGRASIGVWSDEKPTIRHDGIRVDHISQGGPAEEVGVEVGDDILAVGGLYVYTVQQLMDSVRSYRLGSRVALRFRRRSTIYDTFVVIGSEGEMTGTAVSSTIR
jgi:hypothetical protein